MSYDRCGVERARNIRGERRRAVETLVLDLLIDAQDGASADSLMGRLMREAPATGITAQMLDDRRAAVEARR